jgi:hypothetical protein
MKRDGMKNLWRLLAVLSLSVRGSQRELRTLPPTPDSPWSSFVIWILAFGLGLSFGLCHLLPCVGPTDCRARNYDRKTNETNRVYFNNSIGRFTYGKELLNFRKNGNSSKTNHLQLHRVGPPALTARENKCQIDETNRTYSKG